MASITSMINGSSSSISSIYGNRNVLSGLASGMDTESMIENAVSGIKLKIQNLVKKRTKVEWQQDAYRSIIDKAVNFNNKYTSYSSKTNLLSNSFFSNAVNTTTAGTYKDKITASGKTSSEVKINAVKQMATAASYTVSGLGGKSSGEYSAIEAGKGINIAGSTTVSTVSGTVTFQYGGTNGTTFDIKLDELENLNEVEVKDADGKVKEKATAAEKLAQAIQNKLSEVSYSYTKNGITETTTADKVVKVETDPISGFISFSDGLGNGNKVSILSATGNIVDTLGLNKGDTSMRMWQNLTREVDTTKYLSDKELGMTFNGVTKKIKLEDVIKNTNLSSTYDNDPNKSFADALQKEVDKAFGTGKITVNQTADKDGKKSQLSFSTASGSTLSLGGSGIEGLGFEDGDSNFINTSKKLSDLLGDNFFKDEHKLKGEFDVGASPRLSKNGTYYMDSKGNRVDKDGYRITNEGKAIYDFQVNDAHINVTEDTTLENLMNSINSNSDAGVKVSYSKLTNEFKFTATETGANSRVEFKGLSKDLFGDTTFTPVDGKEKVSDILGGFDYGQGNNFKMTIGGEEFSMHVDKNDTIDDIKEKMGVLLTWEHGGDPNDGAAYKVDFDANSNRLVITDKDGKTLDYSFDDDLSKNLFGKLESRAGYTKGQDAVMDVEINGKRFENLTRSGNTFDIDGLTVNVKGTFEAKDDEDYEPVTFNTATDSDKIIDAIRDFVNDYNEMVTEIKSAYSTMPAQKSNGARYEPLTAEEESEYSESEIKAYEEKAKQGILFGDSNLSSMYSKLLSSISPGGTDGQTLREIGITTAYNNGLTTLSLDEDKLRSALESDPDKVRNAFAKTQEGGSTTNGLMQTMQNALNTYVKTTGEPKGVLITRAGSIKAPTSLNNNSLKTQMDSIDTQIERWQNKMSDQIDRYTTKFSRLEQLIAQLNSQASAMSGLMGGNSGY